MATSEDTSDPHARLSKSSRIVRFDKTEIFYISSAASPRPDDQGGYWYSQSELGAISREACSMTRGASSSSSTAVAVDETQRGLEWLVPGHGDKDLATAVRLSRQAVFEEQSKLRDSRRKRNRRKVQSRIANAYSVFTQGPSVHARMLAVSDELAVRLEPTLPPSSSSSVTITETKTEENNAPLLPKNNHALISSVIVSGDNTQGEDSLAIQNCLTTATRLRMTADCGGRGQSMNQSAAEERCSFLSGPSKVRGVCSCCSVTFLSKDGTATTADDPMMGKEIVAYSSHSVHQCRQDDLTILSTRDPSLADEDEGSISSFADDESFVFDAAEDYSPNLYGNITLQKEEDENTKSVTTTQIKRCTCPHCVQRTATRMSTMERSYQMLWTFLLHHKLILLLYLCVALDDITRLKL
mmetsp:Transcript_85898/g.128657  ORF Transcript_85898/g.128657 Transcript_85898/m.128657 type:complete len:412 (-) Transcript_85898:16-1251(-)